MPQVQAHLNFWRLNSPFVQNLICGTVLGLSPGIFTALAALGSGGGKTSSTHLASTVNSTLYAVYAFSGWIAGMLLNTIGPRWTLTLGTIGYPIYIGAFWFYDATGQTWFPILSGVIIGLSGGWLWSTSGWVSVAYSTENQRGLFLSIQIMMTGIGATISSIIAFGLVDGEPQGTGGVPSSVYATFLVLNVLSIVVAAVFMIDPSNIVRNDGTKLAQFSTGAQTSGFAELKGLFFVLKDWRVVILIPVMFATELPIGIQPSLNAYAFNIRTRTLLGVLYAAAQIPVVFIFAPIMDNPKLRRRTRGLLGIFMLTIITLGRRVAMLAVQIYIYVSISWIGELGWMNGKRLDRKILGPEYDWTDPLPFAGFAVIFSLFGALYVTYSLVCLDSFSVNEFPNNLGKIRRNFQRHSGGRDEEYYAFALQAAGLAIMTFICLTQISDSNYFKETDVYTPIPHKAPLPTDPLFFSIVPVEFRDKIEGDPEG
ncbi:hypothetical protein C8R43DRAFT_1152111 [Mycena crocata]|nr:hypothetical protein C8R43DRAFT_1152111 [Mycena crocata]